LFFYLPGREKRRVNMDDSGRLSSLSDGRRDSIIRRGASRFDFQLIYDPSNSTNNRNELMSYKHR